MAKTMCKTKDPEKRNKKAQDPNFKCKNCGREAHKKKHLCKPKKLA